MIPHIFVTCILIGSLVQAQDPITEQPGEFECDCGLFITAFLEDQSPLEILPGSNMEEACNYGYCRNWCERSADTWELLFSLEDPLDPEAGDGVTIGDHYCSQLNRRVDDRPLLTRPRNPDCPTFGGWDPDVVHISGLNFLCCDANATWYQCPEH